MTTQTSMTAITAEPEKATDLSAAAVVYTDWGAELYAARQMGLPMSVPVRTFSPALLGEASLAAQSAEERITRETIRALEDGAVAMSEGLRELFWDDDPDLATVAGAACYADLHILLLKAACLRPEDYDRPVIAVRAISDEPIFANTYISPVADLLGENPALTVIDIPSDRLPAVADPRPPDADLRRRLSFAGVWGVAYRLLLNFGGRFPWRGPRGCMLVLRENELVKECALSLIRRGFSLIPIAIPTVQPETLETSETQRIGDAVSGLIERHFEALIVPPARRGVATRFVTTLTARIGVYRASRAAWRRRLDGLERLRPRGVLTNVLGRPEVAALHSVLRERGLPLVTFQHGTTMELHDRMQHYAAIWENAVSDLSLFFNEEAVTTSERSRFRQGPSVAVGMPADYRRGARNKAARTEAPIWYIGTAIYMGNRGNLFEGVPDQEKAAFEIRVIDDVLARLPHDVLYKPYPGTRYLDPCPILAAADAAPNVRFFESRADLRYFIGAAKVLVTSRSFSTPSWCIMSGRPVVYINIPDQAPLRPEARAAFEAGVFVFDAGESDFRDRLRAFLSRPIAEIEALYAEKAAGRAALVDRFIATGGSGAGRRAARAIEELLTS